MKLTLLRHGITEGNKRHLYYGRTDIPLLPEGEAALRLLAQRGGYPKARRYYTSGLFRTEQTLALLYGDVPHEVLPDLRELDCGDWEMKSYEDLQYDPAYLRWCEDTSRTPCPNGESLLDVQHRSLAALQPILEAEEDAVCVTHGGVICVLLQAWFPVPVEENHLRAPRPGTGYEITVENGVPVSYRSVPPTDDVEEGTDRGTPRF